MKNGLTELVFIIDRSGSMSGLEDDTIGGYNSMLKEQQAVEGEAVVTTVLFDNEYELLHDRINIQAIAPLTQEDYTVGGQHRPAGCHRYDHSQNPQGPARDPGGVSCGEGHVYHYHRWTRERQPTLHS